jgi:hypothetical protein
MLCTALKEHNKLKVNNSKKVQIINDFKKILNANRKYDGEKNIDHDIDCKESNEIYANNNNIDNSITSFKEFELLTSMSTLDNLEKNIEDDDIKKKSDIFNLPQKHLVKSCIDKQEHFKEGKIDTKKKFRKSLTSETIKVGNNKMMDVKNNFDVMPPKLNLKQIQFNLNKQSILFLPNNKDQSSNDKNVMSEKALKHKIKDIKKSLLKNSEIIISFKDFYSTLMSKYIKYNEFIFQPEIESYVLTTQNSI